MHMVTETRQLRDGEKLTKFYNRIDWKPLFNAKTNRKPEIIFKTHCAYVTQCGIIR